MNALQVLRSKVSYGVIALLWVNIAVLVARAVYGTDASIPIILGGGLIITLAATATWYFDRTGPVTRIVTSIAQFAQVSLLVYAFEFAVADRHAYVFLRVARRLRGMDRLAGDRRFRGRNGAASPYLVFCPSGGRFPE